MRGQSFGGGKKGETMHTNSRVLSLVAVLLWLGSFACVIPARLIPPKGITLPGYLLVVYSFPSFQASNPVLYMMAEYSYWIGLVILGVTSGIVILVAGRSTYVKKVVLVDLVVVGISLLTSVLFFGR
jgi:hypothetical protein